MCGLKRFPAATVASRKLAKSFVENSKTLWGRMLISPPNSRR
jgi:hypothetical protein